MAQNWPGWELLLDSILRVSSQVSHDGIFVIPVTYIR
eukprot:gene423-11793_t